MSSDMLGNLMRVLVDVPLRMLGMIYELVLRLIGVDSENWFEAFQRFLRRENPWQTRWPVWRTIEIGRYGTPQAWIGVLEAAGITVTPRARYILDRITFAQVVQDLELVIVTGKELCGDRDVTDSEIFAAAHALGLRTCPAETGPALREQYREQSRSGWLFVAMEAVMHDTDRNLYRFGVLRDAQGMQLGADYGSPASEFPPNCHWVFLAPLK